MTPSEPIPNDARERDEADSREQAERRRIEVDAHLERYWRRNKLYLVVLLSIWCALSFGCGILFVDELDEHRLPGTGFELGFWFAQQGSIYAFLVLIAVYVVLMNRLDREFGFDEP